MSWTWVIDNKLVDKMFTPDITEYIFQIIFFLKFGVSTYYFLILICIFSKRLNSHFSVMSLPQFYCVCCTTLAITPQGNNVILNNFFLFLVRKQFCTISFYLNNWSILSLRRFFEIPCVVNRKEINVYQIFYPFTIMTCQ